MSKFIGRIIQLGMGKETTRGLGVNPSFVLPQTRVNFEDDFVVNSYGERFGNLSGHGSLGYTISKKAKGSIAGEVDAESFGLLLLTAFGSVSSGAVADSAYTHTFTLDPTNIHDSLTLAEINPIGSYRYCLAMLDRLEIEARPEKLVTYNADFISKESVVISKPSLTYLDRKLFTAKHCSLEIRDTIAALTGPNISIRHLKLVFEKSPVEVYCHGALTPQEIFNQQFQISGEFRLDYEDRTWHDYLSDETTKVMRIRLTSDELLGASSVPQFTIDLSKVLFDGWSPDKSLDNVSSQVIRFKALYSTTYSNVVNSCTLINSTATY